MYYNYKDEDQTFWYHNFAITNAIFYKIQIKLYCTNRFERSVPTKFQDATLQTERDKSCNAAFNNAFQLG